ncbi:MAG: hypothetical protein V4700_00935 [Pseudomonadota bacterium]
MKLKQALVLGLTTAVLAIPAFAADEASNSTSLPSSITADQKPSVLTKKEAHKKGHKNGVNKDSLEGKNVVKQTDLNKLS